MSLGIEIKSSRKDFALGVPLHLAVFFFVSGWASRWPTHACSMKSKGPGEFLVNASGGVVAKRDVDAIRLALDGSFPGASISVSVDGKVPSSPRAVRAAGRTLTLVSKVRDRT